MEQAQLSYNDAQRSRDDLSVTATASGVVTSLAVEEGDAVTMSSLLAEIVDRTPSG